VSRLRLSSAASAVLATVLALGACTTTTVPLPRGTFAPRALALTCLGAGGKTVALEDCTSDSGIRVLVSGGTRGTISLAAPSAYAWLDLDTTVPGYTGLRVPGLPGPVAIDAVHGHAYVLLQITRQLARLDLGALGQNKLKVLDVMDLPGDGAAVLLTGTTLWIAATDQGQVWRVDTGTFPSGNVQAFQTGGSPLGLAVAKNKLYVGHLHERHVTVLDLATGAVKTRIGIGPACDNGVDDDGDGLTDRQDTGCDGRDDPTELADEASVSGAVPAACRNGVDDDGDGLTDYPDDPGCTGHGDGDEWSDQGTCRDGVDNNGDGTTDGKDPFCQGNAAGGEHALDPGASLATAADLPCANTLDDDLDGLSDLADPDCYDRTSPSESAGDLDPVASIAATFQGGYVAVTDKARRMLYVIDTTTDTLIEPVPGKVTPFLRASVSAARAGEMGLPLPGLPGAIAAVTLPVQVTPAVPTQRLDFMAVALAGGGLLVVRLESPGLDAKNQPDGVLQRAIGFVPATTQGTTQAGRPSLLIAGIAQELPDQIPQEYTQFGPLRQSTNFGLTFTANELEHRTEVWHFVREGLLPGGVRTAGTLQRPGVLVDGATSFCRMGTLPGDLLLLDVPACAGQPARTVRYPITAVHADALEFDATHGVLDVPVTRANQTTWTTALETPVPQAPDVTCFADRGVRYSVRAAQWLVSGTKSGLSSSRPSLGAECAPLTPDLVQAARLAEPIAPSSTADKPYEPPDCPLQALPADMTPSPYQNLVFSTQILPACVLEKDKAPRLVPSLRDATWSFPVASGFLARSSDVGAAPVAAQSGPKSSMVYVIDEGLPALFVIDAATGSRVPADKSPLQ
jgi:hypothetical protein